MHCVIQPESQQQNRKIKKAQKYSKILFDKDLTIRLMKTQVAIKKNQMMMRNLTLKKLKVINKVAKEVIKPSN